MNAGDLEAAVELYEPVAKVISPGGITLEIVGIREMLANLIETQTRFSGRVANAVQVGEIAVLYSDWRITTNSADATEEGPHKAIEVVRRQPDGSWKLIVGDPGGRG